MPLCKNIPSSEKPVYYKGDEPSPRGKGYCARFCDGKSMKGLDGKMYISKNGRWMKKKSGKKTSPRASLQEEPEVIDKQGAIDNILQYCINNGVHYDQDDIDRLNHFAIVVPQYIIEDLQENPDWTLRNSLESQFGEYPD